MNAVALLLFAVAKPGALIGFQVDQIIHADTAGAGKTFCRFGGGTVFKRGGQGRASALYFTVWLLVGKPGDLYG